MTRVLDSGSGAFVAFEVLSNAPLDVEDGSSACAAYPSTASRVLNGAVDSSPSGSGREVRSRRDRRAQEQNATGGATVTFVVVTPDNETATRAIATVAEVVATGGTTQALTASFWLTIGTLRAKYPLPAPAVGLQLLVHAVLLPTPTPAAIARTVPSRDTGALSPSVTGAIAGGVICGVLVVAMLCCGAALLRRRDQERIARARRRKSYGGGVAATAASAVSADRWGSSLESADEPSSLADDAESANPLSRRRNPGAGGQVASGAVSSTSNANSTAPRTAARRTSSAVAHDVPLHAVFRGGAGSTSSFGTGARDETHVGAANPMHQRLRGDPSPPVRRSTPAAAAPVAAPRSSETGGAFPTPRRPNAAPKAAEAPSAGPDLPFGFGTAAALRGGGVSGSNPAHSTTKRHAATVPSSGVADADLPFGFGTAAASRGSNFSGANPHVHGARLMR